MSLGPSLSRRTIVSALATMAFTPALGATRSKRLDRMMVQGRPQDTGSVYKAGNILRALDQLGSIRKMRCREPFSGTPGWRTYIALAQAGVQFCFTLSGRDVGRSIADLRTFHAQVPGSIWAIEFPNEPDLNPVTYHGVRDARLGFRKGQAPALMGFIAEAHRALHADGALRTIPLIASNDFMQAAQARYSDLGNTHIYPRHDTDVASKLAGFRRKLEQGQHASGVITEWGRTTGGGGTNITAPPVSPAQQARLLCSDVEAALDLPFIKAFNIYELFAWKGAGEMQNFGLFNNDLSPRPVVPMLRAILT